MTQRVRGAMALGLSAALAGSVLLAGCGNATVKSDSNSTSGSNSGGTKNMLVAMDNGSVAAYALIVQGENVLLTW